MAVILVGGLAGVLPPLLGKWLASPDSVTGRAVRAFSGGAILGVALIHIIPEGMELMSAVAASYHGAGGLPVAAGLLLLLFIDYLATYLLAGPVMVFHQALEGLALGSVLALTQLSMLKKLSMAAVFALCMPVGIAVGLAIAGGHDADSLPWLAAQGVLNGVSGGMLLYVSMYSLLAEEFSKTDLIYRPGVAALLAAAVVAGVGSMAVIGIWG
ncbi:hypothetical protein OEZ85_012909 [Tetradesmus obliquus]|uniref:Zinc/iron permease n=1 Tax=Tetradesmus obliquus TaxID=3088 RepID=A0ABY8U415_TETOB|nr:hypothetical protein OEZ85_012909 [Tetradesmus obliquus]